MGRKATATDSVAAGAAAVAAAAGAASGVACTETTSALIAPTELAFAALRPMLRRASLPSLSAAHAGTQYSLKCTRLAPVVVVPIKYRACFELTVAGC